MIVILYLFDFPEFKLAVRNAGIRSMERYTLTIAGGEFGTQGRQLQLCLMAPKRSRQVSIIEPKGAELLEAYPQMAQRFRDARWFEFLTTFEGYDEQVSMEFALNFDGHEVQIGKMLMPVIEKTIAKACRLVVGGERWWKKKNVVTEFVNQFLLPDKQNPDWIRGIPRSWV